MHVFSVSRPPQCTGVGMWKIPERRSRGNCRKSAAASGSQSLAMAGQMPDTVSSSVVSREEFSARVFRTVTLVRRAAEEGAVEMRKESHARLEQAQVYRKSIDGQDPAVSHPPHSPC